MFQLECFGWGDYFGLISLHQYIDGSALSGVTTLNLSHCISIIDMSALDRVTTLVLSECINVTALSVLGGVNN
jgi:hypothetical protein